MEQDMNFNAHLSVLSAIIIGFAIVKLLQGILWMIQGRLKVYWVHLAWVVITILTGINIYWRIGLMPDVRVAEGFVVLTDILLVPLLLYIIASLLFPRSGKDGPVDLKEFYYKNRAWIFGTWMVALLPAVAWEVIRLHASWLYFGMLMLGGLAVTRNQLVHIVVMILMLLGMFAIFLT